MKFKVNVESPVSGTSRVRQLEAMFDVPPSEKSKLSWEGEIPIDNMDWNVGLIVGPSGSGKTTIARELFAEQLAAREEWTGQSVIDDFDQKLSVKEISEVCQAVGFNTIPAWMRPYHVLSNGERFRVEIARAMLERGDPIVVDEFTSVVDRQVAKIGSHAVQKYVRKNNRKFVAIACHYDILDWLLPDWMFEPATMKFTARSRLRRPEVEVSIGRLPRAAWQIFAPYHYLSGSINNQARCYGLWYEGRLASFCGLIRKPHPKAKDIFGGHRMVTLPDFQGMGLAMVLCDTIGALYKAMKLRFHAYPAHPAFIRSFDQSPNWRMFKRPQIVSLRGVNTTNRARINSNTIKSRPCAGFVYAGKPHPNVELARQLHEVRYSTASNRAKT